MSKELRFRKRHTVRFSEPDTSCTNDIGAAPTTVCVACGETVDVCATATYSTHSGDCWHRSCLTSCVVCKRALPPEQRQEPTQRAMCANCELQHDNNNDVSSANGGKARESRENCLRRSHQLMLTFGRSRVCEACGGFVDLTKWHSFVTVRNRDWHRACAVCSACGRALQDRCDMYYNDDDLARGLVCFACVKRMLKRIDTGSMLTTRNVVSECIQATVDARTDRCRGCKAKVYSMEAVTVSSFPRRVYHRRCFRCAHCERALTIDSCVANGDMVMCTACRITKKSSNR